MSSADGPARIAALETWIREHGGRICEAASVVEADGYRGVFAHEGLPADTDFCRIPLKLLITESLAEASLPFGPELRMAAEQLMPSAAGLLLLTALLLQDSAPQAAKAPLGTGAQSFFAPYYQALPVEVQHMPAFWPAEHWLHASLRGSHLERLVKARRHSLGLEFSLLQSQAGKHLSVEWEDFLWCRCMVSSRAYSLPVDGSSHQRCLVPWADLLNHGQGDHLLARYGFQSARDEDEGCPGHFLMRITRPVAEGQEVFQTYGDKTNPTLFVDYGFCLQQGRSITSVNVIPPTCDEHSTAVEREAHAKFWQLAGGRPGRRTLTVEVDESGWRRLLPLLRAANAGEGAACEGPCDVRLETLAWAAFRKLCQEGVMRLTSGEDVLRSQQPSAWEILAAETCAQALQEEIALLRFFMSLGDRALCCLEGSTAPSSPEESRLSQEASFSEYLTQLEQLRSTTT
ncbi:unnamed protein product [Symbiodinium natans]|uniref:SET domain-containing protein n=1 Tax=Symbiodinium natans TaxID=878477 RepID=A0A812QTI9_9DINO|nr:unnamed protein product [Symbiodinium natans]